VGIVPPSDLTQAQPYLRYGCALRPFHGGDVDALLRDGFEVDVEPATETPAPYKYSIRTNKRVPKGIREHFGLDLITE
jgi:hypothetical protein